MLLTADEAIEQKDSMLGMLILPRDERVSFDVKDIGESRLNGRDLLCREGGEGTQLSKDGLCCLSRRSGQHRQSAITGG